MITLEDFIKKVEKHLERELIVDSIEYQCYAEVFKILSFEKYDELWEFVKGDQNE